MEKYVILLILGLGSVFIYVQAAATNASEVAGVGSAIHQYLNGSQLSLKCGQSKVVVLNGTFEIMKNCYRKTYFTNNKTRNEVTMDQKSCPFVCIAQSLGMMNATGKIVRQKVKTIFEESIPSPSTKSAEIISLVNSCADLHEGTIALKPGNCTTVKPFFMCAFDKVFGTCGYDVRNMDIHMYSDECDDQNQKDGGQPAKTKVA